MKIFVASAELREIAAVTESGLADGVVTTPRLLADAAPGDERALLADICRATNLPVCASVGSVSAADIVRDGRELARISDAIVVQIPLVEDAITAMRRLSAEGIRVSATLVFNAAQALLAAKAGAAMVSAQLDHLEAQGQDASAALREIRGVFDVQGTECDLLAWNPRTAAQFVAAALAGSDAVSLDPAVLHALLLHPLTDRGLDQFLSELSRHGRPRLGV